MTNIENELIDLQTRIAYQEDLLSELNNIVIKQDAEILTLKQQVRQLAKKMEDFLANPESDGVEISMEKPPHY
jgi:SlyX protein